MKILLVILLCVGFAFADGVNPPKRKHRRKHKAVVVKKVEKTNPQLPLPKSPSLLISTQELAIAPFVRPLLTEAPPPPVLKNVTVTQPDIPEVAIESVETPESGKKKWWLLIFSVAVIPFLFHDHDQPPVVITPASVPVQITPFTVPPTASTPESSTIILFALGIGLLRIGKVVWENN